MSRRTLTITYDAPPTAARLHASDAFYRGMLGCVRSGKSTTCSNEIFRRMTEQHQLADGLRHSRWLVVRNTYRELEDTTIRTWLDWFPEEIFGKMNRNSMSHRIKFNDVRASVDFRALDKPGDIKKLLSAEYTGAWVNEAREIPKPVIDVVGDRVGQYPAKKDGGCTWAGVIMDTNPPDTDHWWYILFEEEKPDGWELFRQPGALMEVKGEWRPNPEAENIEHLNEGIDYYLKRVGGKDRDYIRVYYCGEYGFVMEGKPVHPLFKQHVHVATEPLVPVAGLTVGYGADFGLTPAGVFGQVLPSGQVRIYKELVTHDMGAERFGGEMTRMINHDFARHEVLEGWGDPSGDKRSEIRETENVFKILRGQGLDIFPAKSNDPILRQESLNHLLGRLDMGGNPAIIIDPSCRYLIKGLAGGYKYKRLNVAGLERYDDKPDKNIYSHVCEALHYYLLGMGMGMQVIDGRDTGGRTKPKVRGAMGRRRR